MLDLVYNLPTIYYRLNVYHPDKLSDTIFRISLIIKISIFRTTMRNCGGVLDSFVRKVFFLNMFNHRIGLAI